MMEYNALDKVYTYNEYNSLGEHVMAVGTVQGNTWVWNTEEKLNGVVTKGRYTVTFVIAEFLLVQVGSARSRRRMGHR